MASNDNTNQYQKMQRDIFEVKAKKSIKEQPLLSQQEIEQLKPKTFKQKWENFWYHYKLMIFGVLFLLLILWMGIYYSVTSIKYDYEIIYVTSKVWQGDQQAFKDAFSKYGVDINGDNKVNVGITQITMPKVKDPENIELDSAMIQKLALEIVGRDSSIFVFDDHTYDYIDKTFGTGKENKKIKLFSLLNEIYQNKNTKNDRFYIAGTDFGKLLKVDVPKDFSISVRTISTVSDNEKLTKKYKNDLELIKNILKGEKKNEK